MVDYNSDCEKCEYDFYRLLELLVKDIQQLEIKVVRLRYLLSGFLPPHESEMLKCEIFSDLSGRYYDDPAYQQYMANYCDGQDPMENAEIDEYMLKVAKGKEIVDI